MLLDMDADMNPETKYQRPLSDGGRLGCRLSNRRREGHKERLQHQFRRLIACIVEGIKATSP